jgi:hypothetical protein
MGSIRAIHLTDPLSFEWALDSRYRLPNHELVTSRRDSVRDTKVRFEDVSCAADSFRIPIKNSSALSYIARRQCTASLQNVFLALDALQA